MGISRVCDRRLSRLPRRPAKPVVIAIIIGRQGSLLTGLYMLEGRNNGWWRVMRHQRAADMADDEPARLLLREIRFQSFSKMDPSFEEGSVFRRTISHSMNGQSFEEGLGVQRATSPSKNDHSRYQQFENHMWLVVVRRSTSRRTSSLSISGRYFTEGSQSFPVIRRTISR